MSNLHKTKIKSDFGLSKESRFVGYVVLGFGVLAVISVLLIAANKFGGHASPSSSPSSSTQENETMGQNLAPVSSSTQNPEFQNRVAKDLMGNMNENVAPPEKNYQKPDKNELYFKRQPDIKPSDIEGHWQSMVENNTVVLQMGKGVYQIIIADPNHYSERMFSSGTYTMIEDVVILEPKLDWPKPTPPANTDVQYTNVTMVNFPVIAAMKSGKMLWQNPPSTETRTYVPRSLVLLTDPAQGFLVWQRTK